MMVPAAVQSPLQMNTDEAQMRDLVEMMAERGLSLARRTILRRVQRYSPESVKRWNRFGTPTGQCGVSTRPT
jgi:transposase-like protein